LSQILHISFAWEKTR